MSVCVEMRAPCPVDRRTWLAWIGAMLRAAASARALPGQENAVRDGDCPESGEMDVLLVVSNDGETAGLNARALGCTGPTNILSFPGEGRRLGDLFLSADTLARECVLYGQDHTRHAVRLLAHGMGHISGYDHGPEMDCFCTMLEEAAFPLGKGRP